MSTILRDLDDAWSGRAADAFRTRLEEFHSRLDDSTDAMTTARKSIITYRDAVVEISRLAEPLKEELAASQAALSGVMNDASFGGEPGDRFAAEQEARAAASTAVTALKKLAVDRQAADSDLAVSLATAASLGWGDLDCTTDPVPGTRRDATNDRVMDLFEHFRTGDERGAVLTDNDIFVQTLMRSTTSPQPGSKYSTSCEAESSRRWLRVLTIDRSVISRWCWAPTGSTLCLAR